MLFFDETIHCVQSVERVGLLFAMDENCVGKFLGVPLHIQDIVGQKDFFGVLCTVKRKHPPIVNLVKCEDFLYRFSEVGCCRESTQQLSIVLKL